MYFARPGETQKQAKERIEREALVVVPAPDLPVLQPIEGLYAPIIRQLNEDNGRTVYAGDLQMAKRFIPSLQPHHWDGLAARWLLDRCEPIQSVDAYAVVCTALRRNLELTRRRFSEAGLEIGIVVFPAGARLPRDVP